MKLSSRNEWIAIAVLILYLTFTPGFPIVRELLSSSVGKAAFLGAVVYVWKYVSKIIAVLLLVGYIRCASMTGVWEGLEMAATTCTCPAGFTYDSTTKKCKNAAGLMKDPVACTCPSGYTYDITKKECVVSSVMSEPISATPPAVDAMPTDGGAPILLAPTTSTAPMTTPGAAQEAVGAAPSSGTSTPPTVMPSAPATEQFSLLNAYPL
jgi:hypothetical protein